MRAKAFKGHELREAGCGDYHALLHMLGQIAEPIAQLLNLLMDLHAHPDKGEGVDLGRGVRVGCHAPARWAVSP